MLSGIRVAVPLEPHRAFPQIALDRGEPATGQKETVPAPVRHMSDTPPLTCNLVPGRGQAGLNTAPPLRSSQRTVAGLALRATDQGDAFKLSHRAGIWCPRKSLAAPAHRHRPSGVNSSDAPSRRSIASRECPAVSSALMSSAARSGTTARKHAALPRPAWEMSQSGVITSSLTNVDRPRESMMPR